MSRPARPAADVGRAERRPGFGGTGAAVSLLVFVDLGRVERVPLSEEEDDDAQGVIDRPVEDGAHADLRVEGYGGADGGHGSGDVDQAEVFAADDAHECGFRSGEFAAEAGSLVAEQGGEGGVDAVGAAADADAEAARAASAADDAEERGGVDVDVPRERHELPEQRDAVGQGFGGGGEGGFERGVLGGGAQVVVAADDAHVAEASGGLFGLGGLASDLHAFEAERHDHEDDRGDVALRGQCEDFRENARAGALAESGDDGRDSGVLEDAGQGGRFVRGHAGATAVASGAGAVEARGADADLLAARESGNGIEIGVDGDGADCAIGFVRDGIDDLAAGAA